MTPGVVRLEAAGLTAFTLEEATGLIVSELDLGFPEPRVVSARRPDADGEDDTTRHFGARAVTIAATVVPTEAITRRSILDRLAAFFRLDTETFLYWDDEDDGIERRMLIRVDQHRRPINSVGAFIQVGWRAPDGIQEAADETLDTASAAPESEAGRTYDRTYPLSYPESSPVGSVTVDNEGNTTAYPLLQLYGPAVNPRIENATTGGRLVFAGITLAAGDFLEIDTRARTILLDGNTGSSRYDDLDFAESSWFALAPGENLVRYYPESFDDGAEAIIRFRSAWI